MIFIILAFSACAILLALAVAYWEEVSADRRVEAARRELESDLSLMTARLEQLEQSENK